MFVCLFLFLFLSVCLFSIAHIGCGEFLSIIHVVHGDLSILHKVVALDLAGEQQLVQQLLVSTSEELVEDVVATLSWLL